MTTETIRPAVPFTADTLAHAVNEAARQLVDREVHYCVSSLISALTKAAYLDSDAANVIRSDIADDTTLSGLAMRSPNADDYLDAVPHGERVTVIERDEDGAPGAGLWEWFGPNSDSVFTDDGGEYPETELEAWQSAFRANGWDEPDGSEVYEHWLVSDWFADKLEARGETVARDIGGLTVWGRCTTGQAIYADYVVQEIARDLHDLPRTAA